MPVRSSASSPTLPADRVPIKAKISFGIGGMVGQFTGNLTKELINPVYVVALHLSPALVGTAMMIFRLYDAGTDPIMGWVSDNTRTRWGRRTHCEHRAVGRVARPITPSARDGLGCARRGSAAWDGAAGFTRLTVQERCSRRPSRPLAAAWGRRTHCEHRPGEPDDGSEAALTFPPPSDSSTTSGATTSIRPCRSPNG